MTRGANPVSATEPDAPKPPLLRRAARLVRRLGPAGPLAVAAAVLPVLGSLAIYERLHVIGPWLRAHPVAGPFWCAGLFAVAGGASLVPTYALSGLCGWSFGFGAGLAAAAGGFLAAALVGYAVARVIVRGRVMAVVDDSPRWRAIHAAVAAGGFGRCTLVVALVRLAPAAPFSLTNLVMASMRIPPLPYAAGTLLGMLPRTALLVFAASRLADLKTPPSEEPWLFAAGVAATIVAVVALGWIGKKGLARVAAPTA